MAQTSVETPSANKRTGQGSLVIYWREWEIKCHFSNKTDDFSNISRLAGKTLPWQIWECQQDIPNILFPCCFFGDIKNLTFVVLKSTKGGKIPETSFWWDYPKLKKVQESGKKTFLVKAEVAKLLKMTMNAYKIKHSGCSIGQWTQLFILEN